MRLHLRVPSFHHQGTSIIIAGVAKDRFQQANRTSMQRLRVSCVCLPKSVKKQSDSIIRFGVNCPSTKNRTWAACCKASAAGLKSKAHSCRGTRVKDWVQVIVRGSNKTNVRVILGKPANVTKTSNGTASTAVPATKTAVKIAPLNKTTSGHCLKGACAANFVFSIYGKLCPRPSIIQHALILLMNLCMSAHGKIYQNVYICIPCVYRTAYA